MSSMGRANRATRALLPLVPLAVYVNLEGPSPVLAVALCLLSFALSSSAVCFERKPGPRFLMCLLYAVVFEATWYITDRQINRADWDWPRTFMVFAAAGIVAGCRAYDEWINISKGGEPRMSNPEEPPASANPSIANGNWATVEADGYSLDLSHYSNKGPLLVVRDAQGHEIARARFDLSTKKWNTSAS